MEIVQLVCKFSLTILLLVLPPRRLGIVWISHAFYFHLYLLKPLQGHPYILVKEILPVFSPCLSTSPQDFFFDNRNCMVLHWSRTNVMSGSSAPHDNFSHLNLAGMFNMWRTVIISCLCCYIIEFLKVNLSTFHRRVPILSFHLVQVILIIYHHPICHTLTMYTAFKLARASYVTAASIITVTPSIV